MRYNHLTNSTLFDLDIRYAQNPFPVVFQEYKTITDLEVLVT